MNYNISLCLSKANDRLTQTSVSTATAAFSHDSVLAEKKNKGTSRDFLRHSIKKTSPLCTISLLGLLSLSSLTLGVENITEDVSIEGTEDALNNLNAINYTTSDTIVDIISAKVSATSTGNNIAGIYSANGLTINTINSSSLISASGKNYIYAIRIESGSLSISNSIQGSFSATSTGNDAAAIYLKNGTDIQLNGISETSTLSAQAKIRRAFGIFAEKSGDIAILGALNGTINATSAGDAKGIWAAKGFVTIESIGEKGSINVQGGIGIHGIQAQSQLSITGDLAGKINVTSATGNRATGLYSNSNDLTIRGTISIGSITKTGGIFVETTIGTEAIGIQSAYDNVQIGNIDGEIIATSGKEQTDTAFSAVGILTRYDIELGDIGETGKIIASSQGKDAYAAFAGKDGGSTAIALHNITVGNIDGSISATAATGTSAGLYGNKISIGDMGENGSIKGIATATGDAFGIYASYLLQTGEINGTISATTQGDVAIAMIGLGGINTSFGSTARIEATGGAEAKNVYALFSGCFQGGQYTTYNVSDNISIAAGASIKGIIELGGSGAGYDNITLTGGTAEQQGRFDFAIQRTINMHPTQQTDESRFSHLALTIGEQVGKEAYWNFTTPDMSFEKILIHHGATLSSDRSLLASEANSSIINYGTLEGTYSLNIGADMSLMTGSLGINTATGKLSIISTGLGKGITLSAEDGATLGTSLINDTQGTWLVSMESLQEQRAELYKQLLGKVDLSQYSFTYYVQGNILLNEGKPVTMNPDDSFNLGVGSIITVGSNLPDQGITLSGGTADVTGSGKIISDKQVSGSSGTLVTTTDQELVLNQSQNVGYTVSGSANDLTAGAKVLIGTEPSASPLELTLSGNIYSNDITIESGKVTLSKTGSLGMKGGTISVSNDTESGQQSSLINNGNVLSNVTVANQATLQGSGSFYGLVSLDNANLIVGNSPGQMVYHEDLTVENTSVRFTLDGTQKSILGSSRTGTYSNILMAGTSSIDWKGGNSIILDIWAGLADSSTQNITVDLFNGAAIDLSQTAISLAGDYKQLVDENSIIVNADGSLSFKLNSSYAENILSDDARNTANTMWSSARTLSYFTQAASAQMDAPRTAQSRHFWGMGIGDFMNMDSFRSNSSGYAIGGDYNIAKAWILGASFGNTYGTNTADDNLIKTDQDALMMAIYGRYAKKIQDKNSLIFDASFGYGSVDNKSIGTFLGEGGRQSSWQDNVFTAGLHSKLNIEQRKGLIISPFIGIDFEIVQQDDINVNHAQGSFNYSNGSMYRLSIPIGVSITKRYTINETQYLLPSLSIAYVGDVAREIPHLDRNVLGTQSRFYGDNPGRSAVKINIGTHFMMSQQWSSGVFYNFEARSGLINHAVNASVNYSF